MYGTFPCVQLRLANSPSKIDQDPFLAPVVMGRVGPYRVICAYLGVNG
jgi:hypothetical protein